ncbi:MAG: FtsK/SpoIIIE domain-containing protein [Streptococcus salivarius]|nr:FtsK/SpoIIIE domain-containing protein [Streptococcus salivarius]
MAKVYKKNANNVYKLPLYSQKWFWLLLILVLLVVFAIIFSSWFWVLFISVMFWWTYSVFRHISKAGGLKKYFTELSAERAITKSLLATMSVNRMQDTPFISVPKVEVSDSRPRLLEVGVEKLAGMYDIDKLTEDIDASLRGNLGNYAVTSGIVTTDGLKYKFVLEDVASDKTWRPKTPKDLLMKKYHLKLQKGLVINLADRPHIAIWGKTGSKKTTVLLGMILQLFSQGADLRFLDGKNEFSAFEEFYPSDKIASTVEAVQKQIDDLLTLIDERQKIMSSEVRKRQKMGLRASEVGLQLVVLIADEIGSLVALMDNKQQKKFINGLVAIIQRGRSVGVSVFASTQDPSVDTLPQKIRQQFSTKILLGLANQEVQRMAFGEVATKGDVEDFRGYYVSDGLTNQPMKFFVCDLYSYGFNQLKIFNKSFDSSIV